MIHFEFYKDLSGFSVDNLLKESIDGYWNGLGKRWKLGVRKL